MAVDVSGLFQMNGTNKRKQTVHFSAATLEEIIGAATRLDRSLSWIVQKAWKVARKEIMRRPPSATDRADDRDVPQVGAGEGE